MPRDFGVFLGMFGVILGHLHSPAHQFPPFPVSPKGWALINEQINQLCSFGLLLLCFHRAGISAGSGILVQLCLHNSCWDFPLGEGGKKFLGSKEMLWNAPKSWDLQ